MRVKKFEAKTMKDALRMVKNELGPDAIILAARDNRKSYGLAGEGSVEVTAAVSESTLHKKKFVESRMRGEDVTRFQAAPARQQKQFIDKMAGERLRQFAERQISSAAAPAPKKADPKRTITPVSYIDIQDEETPYQQLKQSRRQSNEQTQQRGSQMSNVSGRNVRDVINDYQAEGMYEAGGGKTSDPARERIRSAAQEAWRAGLTTAVEDFMTQTQVKESKEFEIINLKQEINRLQEKLNGSAQNMPQTFVGGHPGAEHGINYDLSFMFQKLHEAGISTENTVQILLSAQKQMDAGQQKKRPLVDAYVGRWILNSIQTAPTPYAGRVHCFVGGSGSGKTSTLVKMASQLVINEKKRVAVITTDAAKVGASDQLKTYCQILNVPFAIVRNQKEWAWVLSQLTNVDHILVDYPGMQLHTLEEIQFLKTILPPEQAAATFHLVMSATAKDNDTLELARRYKQTNFQDLIFTNLDQSVQHGVVYNVHRKTGKPLHSFGIGTRLPEDFELATKERVLDLIFRLTRIRK